MNVVYFDGVCNLCNAVVNFLIDQDKEGKLKFASLQSEAGEAMLHQLGLSTESYDSFIYKKGMTKYFIKVPLRFRYWRRWAAAGKYLPIHSSSFPVPSATGSTPKYLRTATNGLVSATNAGYLRRNCESDLWNNFDGMSE